MTCQECGTDRFPLVVCGDDDVWCLDCYRAVVIYYTRDVDA